MKKWLIIFILLLPLVCSAQDEWELIIEHDTQVEVHTEEQQALSAPLGLAILHQYYEIEVGPLGGPYLIKRTYDVYYLYDDLEPGVEYEARARSVENGKPGTWSEWVQVQTLGE
jgi:hypothetical protein